MFVLTIVIFALARLAGDPVPLVLGTEATPEDIQFYRRRYGLDKPLLMQYRTFLGSIKGQKLHTTLNGNTTPAAQPGTIRSLRSCALGCMDGQIDMLDLQRT